MANEHVSEETVSEEPTIAPKKYGPFTLRRWIAIGFFLIIIMFIMRPILDPFGNKEYMEIPHGNHVHYVPKDKDPNVSVSNFPTTPPGPNERITPDGRIVPK